MDTNSEQADSQFHNAVRADSQFGNLASDSFIAIVGGSLVGPAQALLLQQAGFTNVHVYEASPSAVSQAGGVVGVDHATLGVLDSLGIDRAEYVPFESERIVSIKVADRRESGRVQTWYPGRNTTWTLLHGSLVRRLPVGTFHTGKRVTGLSSDELDRAMLSFADGEEVTPDLVVFADGRRSFGRRVLDPHRQLRYAGYVAHRGLLVGGPEDGVFDYVRLVSDGMQFGAFPVLLPDGRMGLDWEFNLNTPSDLFSEQFGRNPTVRTYVLPHQISEAARQEVDIAAKRLLPADTAELIERTTTRTAAPIVDIAPPEWMVARIGGRPVVMEGDALAPVHPLTARGLNNGIVQADGLALALVQHHRYGANLDAALGGWQARFLPQVIADVQRGPLLARKIGLGQ